ncbi:MULTISPECIES: HigA family addiction module antitoxin [Rosenbergiella]|uniref:HigA family addiction module antitoxin n=1 Tax=Rosenbergiella TaxID=1356488 RepID=UPI001F4FBADB|nr:MULTISPECIES: HigA family addiction module antitoxin [Rosenbergiella]
MTTKRIPPHPGRFIAEEMAYLDISLRALARALAVSPSTIGRIIEGTASLTPNMAVRLAAVIGSTPEMWLKLQASHSLAQARQEVDISELIHLSKPETASHIA